MQELSDERLDRRQEQPASDPLSEEEKQPREMKGSQESHHLKRKRKGNDKRMDRRYCHRRSRK